MARRDKKDSASERGGGIATPRFAAVMASQVLSLLGMEILQFVLPLHLLNLTGSGALYGGVVAAGFVPYTLLAPVGGVVADRTRKRGVMVAVGAALAAAMAAYLPLAGTAAVVPATVAVLMLAFAAQALEQPCVQSAIPHLVAPSEVGRAVALVNQVGMLMDVSHCGPKTAYDAVSSNRTAKGIGVTAPIRGHVKNIEVREGEYVTTGQPLAAISQNTRLVLRAEVSEKYYNALSHIRTANFKTPYDNKVYSLSELNGKLISHGRTSGEDTFYVPVSFEFDNKGDIIPGSLVEIYLISKPMENALAIPVSALTNELGTFYVYVQVDEEGYRKQEVTLGANNGKEVQVLKGLRFGDRVVTQGAYQVKMASASGAIPGHSHSH